MYRKLLLLSLALLSGCGGNGKVHGIIEFTPRLMEDQTNAQAILPNLNPANHALPVALKAKSFKLDGSLIAAPAILKDKVVMLSSAGSATAYDLEFSKQLWHNNLVGTKTYSYFAEGGVIEQDNKLFITNGSRVLYALNADNGYEIFRKTFPDLLFAAPVVRGNIAIILTANNQLFGTDVNKAVLGWENYSTPEILTTSAVVQPIFDQSGAVLVPYSSGNISLLEAASGKVIWAKTLSQQKDSVAGFSPMNFEVQPIISDGKIYVAANNGNLLRLDLATGATDWQKPIKDVMTMQVVGNLVILTTNARQVAAVLKDNGQILWVADIVPDVAPGKTLPKLKPLKIIASKIIASTLAIFADDGQVFYFSPFTGAKLGVANLAIKPKFVVGEQVIWLFNDKAMLAIQAADR